MLGAFKDAFGKKAADLHKKEFFDAKVEKKFTLKSKTADGVSFEGSMDAKGASELNLNFKDSDMEVKNKLDNKAQFTVDSTMFKVADGLDATCVFKTPACSDSNKALFEEVTVGAKYATADLNVNPTVCMKFADGFAPDSFSAGVTAVAKVMDDVNAGLNVEKIANGEKGISCDLDVAVAHACKDAQLAAHFLAGVADNQFSVKSLNASFWQQATPDTAVAAAFSCDTAMKVGIILGTDYKLTDLSNVKTKVTYVKDAAPTIDLAWIHKFDNKTLSISHTAGNSANFGVSLTIDA